MKQQRQNYAELYRAYYRLLADLPDCSINDLPRWLKIKNQRDSYSSDEAYHRAVYSALKEDLRQLAQKKKCGICPFGKSGNCPSIVQKSGFCPKQDPASPIDEPLFYLSEVALNNLNLCNLN